MVELKVEVEGVATVEGWIGVGPHKAVTGLRGRPVDWPALARALREGWKEHTTTISTTTVTWVVQVDPVVAFDVNLTPDKRQVVLERGEVELCAALTAAVAQLQPQQEPQQRRPQRRFAFVHSPEVAEAAERRMTAISAEAISELQCVGSDDEDDGPSEEKKDDSPSLPVEEESVNSSSDKTSSSSSSVDEDEVVMAPKSPQHTINSEVSEGTDHHTPPRLRKRKQATDDVLSGNCASTPTDSERRQWRKTQEHFNSPPKQGLLEKYGFRATVSTGPPRRVVSVSGSNQRQASSVLQPSESPEPSIRQRKVSVGVVSSSPTTSNNDNPSELPCSQTTPQVWSSFRDTDAVLQAHRDDQRQRTQRKEQRSATPSDTPEQQTDSHTRLSKSDFKTMEVLGQFNMGFIVARTKPDGNIWILDQHGCTCDIMCSFKCGPACNRSHSSACIPSSGDEKANFERLCAETVIHEQPLIAPLPLELSSMQESCILDHMHIFETNGFRFQYDPTKPPRFRLALTALPHSGAQDGRKAVQYGKDDVIALCSLLSGEIVEGGTGTDGTGMYGNNAGKFYLDR